MPKELHVEHFMRDAFIPGSASVSPEMILDHVPERGLGLRRSS